MSQAFAQSRAAITSWAGSATAAVAAAKSVLGRRMRDFDSRAGAAAAKSALEDVEKWAGESGVFEALDGAARALAELPDNINEV